MKFSLFYALIKFHKKFKWNFLLFYFNYTPLYLASSEDHTNIVRILLECPNIDVNSATYVPKFLLTMKFLPFFVFL